MKARKPATFALDDPRVRVETAEPASFTAPAADADLPVPAAPEPRKRRFRWGTLFWLSAAGLVLLALGLGVVNLVVELFSYSQGAGWIGAALAMLAAVALLAVVIRESIGLMRLASVDAIRDRAISALATDDRKTGQAVVADLVTLTNRMPRLARGRARLEEHRSDIIDGRDLVHLAERDLMAPLDAEARRLIGSAAKRVSVITAVSPRAAIDMLFVLMNGIALMRKLATLYGARPGLLGMVRLFRHVVAHLAVTGGLAVTDGLIQQVIGHGVAAKLSARLGEGVLNGLLTARLGLAAMDVTRPLPFAALPRPSLNDLAGSLLRGAETEPEPKRPAKDA